MSTVSPVFSLSLKGASGAGCPRDWPLVLGHVDGGSKPTVSERLVIEAGDDVQVRV
jgi:hypothetical protein